MNRLELTGLTARPSQVWGGVRLVPLVREAPVEGLRLHREVYEGLGAGVVELGPRAHYVSYIPHGLVADWSGEDGPAPEAGRQSAAYGTQFGGGGSPRAVPLPPLPHHRLAKRRPGDRLRFLPPFVRDRGGQHIGETITDHRGQVAYLKTFRLSDPQIRRGHLLRTLAGADWELDRAAAALGSSREELIRRLRAAGFSALLKGGV